MQRSQPGSKIRASASSYRYDDLELVAVINRARGEFAARHDLAVTLDCDALAGETELIDQRLHVNCGGKAAKLAVDGDGQHGSGDFTAADARNRPVEQTVAPFR